MAIRCLREVGECLDVTEGQIPLEASRPACEITGNINESGAVTRVLLSPHRPHEPGRRLATGDRWHVRFDFD